MNDTADTDGQSTTRGIMDKAYALARRFWPGPLTMILPKGSMIPPQTTGGLDTVAVRFPSHPIAQALLAEKDTVFITRFRHTICIDQDTVTGLQLDTLGMITEVGIDTDDQLRVLRKESTVKQRPGMARITILQFQRIQVHGTEEKRTEHLIVRIVA